LKPAHRTRWSGVRTVDDFEQLARKRTPRAVYDFVAGAAELELSRDGAVDAFRRCVFHPRVLRDVAGCTTATTVLGASIRFPVILGPTGFTRIMHAAGESAVARAAGRAGLPYVLSTLGTTSIEELAEDAPATDRWFQLYLWKDRARSQDFLARARDSGYRVLVLTVDTPVAGARHRDVRNGLTIPPSLTPRTVAGILRKPRWLFDLLTTKPLAFESLGEATNAIGLINTIFDPSVTIDDIGWLRSEWPGPIVVKGIQRGEDAKNVAAAGADAIAVSNHGGRQLDRAAAPLDVLPRVIEAVGDSTEVYVDGGVRSGSDVAIAVDLGARAVFVARPYLYALMAGGESGVDHLLALLLDDYARTLRLLGVSQTSDLDGSFVTRT